MSPADKTPPGGPAVDCATVAERLLDYIYDELGPDETRAFAAHLSTCARCEAEAASFGRVRSAVASLPLLEPSPAVSLRILEAAAAAIGAPAHQQAVAATLPPTLRLASSQPSAGPAAPVERRRSWKPGRVLRHPGFAAAASFVVVLGGVAWLSTTEQSAMVAPTASTVAAPAAEVPAENSAPPPSPAAAPATSPSAAPVAAVQPSRPSPSGARPEGPPGAAASATAAEPMAARPMTRSAAREGLAELERSAGTGSSAPPAPKSALAADDALDSALGATAARGSVGDGRSVAARPTRRAEALPPPAVPRAPSGHGQWLGADQNDVLARDVRAAAAPPPSSAPPASPAPVPSKPISPPLAPAASNAMGAALADRRVAGTPRERGSDGVAQKKEQSAGGSPQAQASLRQEEKASASKADADEQAAEASAIGEAQRAQSKARQDLPAAKAIARSASAPSVEAQAKLAEFRAAAEHAAHCDAATTRYEELRAREPNFPFTAKDRWAEALCLKHLQRYDEARVMLYSLRADAAPKDAETINRELAAVAAAVEQSYMARRKMALEPAPAAPAAAPAKKASKAKAAAPADVNEGL